MSYLDRVLTATHHDLNGFLPFLIEKVVVGFLRPALVEVLRGYSEVFRVEDDHIALSEDLKEPGARTEAVDSVLELLRTEGLIGRAVGEQYGVVQDPGDRPLMSIERSAVEAFGIIATGFHLNGLVGDHMWIARRSRTKMTFPGQLDNMVAGGWPVGIMQEENVIKECGEEAGMSRELARQADPVGVMTYVMEVPTGLRRHAMYLYDLELPADFTPHAVDGEVESFQLNPIEEVADMVRETDEFKYNSALAVIDYLIRSDRINSTHPDHASLVAGMKSSLQSGFMLRSGS